MFTCMYMCVWQDELDVRGCITAILMTLLQAEDEEVTKNLVEQKGWT